MRPTGGPHAKLNPMNLPTEQPFLVRWRTRETWPRVRRLRTGTTYWQRSFCMGRGRCESQPDLTFVGPANAANDRQGCCPIQPELLATGQPGVPEAPSPTSYRHLEILLAGLQLLQPRISYSTSWFRSPLHWDAESLLHQDGFNSLIARLLERRKSTAGLRLEVRQAKASPSPRARLLRHLRLLCAPSRPAGPGRFPGP